jgi:hypothetical protein
MTELLVKPWWVDPASIPSRARVRQNRFPRRTTEVNAKQQQADEQGYGIIANIPTAGCPRDGEAHFDGWYYGEIGRVGRGNVQGFHHALRWSISSSGRKANGGMRG